MIAKNIKCISNVGLEALRILFYSYWSFFRLEVCVYYYFYLGYLSSLSRTAYKPNYAFRAFRPYASNVYDNRKRTSSYAFKN